MTVDEKTREFRDTFRIEAEEHIRAISSGLMELEKNPDREKCAEPIEEQNIMHQETER